ncbi:MAG: ArgE/DapE family deacylase [Methanoregula sp.]|jgi:succinyl-diaminopimelate desuccinylase
MHVSRICSDLVRIRSENPPGSTAEVIEYIRAFLETIGIHSHVSGNAGGMCNLVTQNTGQSLILCGHVDVVPARDAAWAYPPFSGRIDNKYVHGRGSTDMKGGCASILSACEAIVNAGHDLPATLVFVCDEETGGENGTRRLLADGVLTPCDCLIAEPTPSLHPAIGQKGLCRLELEFTGVPAHGSLYPAVGVSAIMEAMALIEYVHHLHKKDYPVSTGLEEILTRSADVLKKEFNLPEVRDILRHITYNPGTIHGGEKANVVAEHCVLELEMRVPWGCAIPDLKSDIMAHAKNAKIRLEESHNPSMTDPASTIVTTTCAEVRKVWGGEVFPIVQWAASDARHLRLRGFNVIEYGPGEITSLHAVNERVTIESLEKAALVYRGLMERYEEMNGERS